MSDIDDMVKSIDDEIMKSLDGPDSFIYGSTLTCTQAERTLTMESLNASLKEMQDALLGFKIIESRWLTKRIQFRFPRTRKKRMMKKWLRNSRNFRDVPSLDIYQTPFGVVCHPEMAKSLRRAALKAVDKWPPPGEGGDMAHQPYCGMRAYYHDHRMP